MTLNVLENIPLAPLTTLKIGGNARYFVRAETEEQVADAVRFASENSLNLFILGGGSNVLVSDAGFDGLVVQIALKGRLFNSELETSNSKLVIVVGAGEDWDEFVAHCVDNNLAGVECLSGIPGFVGGTPVQNVGAYGQEVSETIVEVRCLDRTTGEIVAMSNADCGFSYRTSIFNSTCRDRYIVLSVTYALTSGGKAKIAYKDLIEYFKGKEPTLSDMRKAVLAIRARKSMVIDPDDPNSKSAGSFFKNPVVDRRKLEEIRHSYPGVPSFDFDNLFKVPAAWLIENAGFDNGFSLGNAGISTKHTLALINRGGASATEIIALKDRIQLAVFERFGIKLQPEPVFIGF